MSDKNNFLVIFFAENLVFIKKIPIFVVNYEQGG